MVNIAFVVGALIPGLSSKGHLSHGGAIPRGFHPGAIYPRRFHPRMNGPRRGIGSSDVKIKSHFEILI